MPVSKRIRNKSLTKVSSKGKECKLELMNNVRNAIDKYSTVYVFSYENMRTNHFKKIRHEFQDSRFFLVKHKVIQLALGKNDQDSYSTNLHQLSPYMKGNVGLLCTNQNEVKVIEYLTKVNIPDFARSGGIANKDVELKAGPLEQFPGSMVENLRLLGLPLQLKNGVIQLLDDFKVCEKNKILTPEQAKILVHLDLKMAHFKIQLLCKWTDGKFTTF